MTTTAERVLPDPIVVLYFFLGVVSYFVAHPTSV